MTAQEHANAIWRAEPSPEALAGAISAYTDELRGEIHKLASDHAAEVERLTAENAALKEEVQCNKDERADLVKLLDCHPAFLRHEIIRMQDQVRELPSIDRHREIQADLTTARARIAELEGVLESVRSLTKAEEGDHECLTCSNVNARVAALSTQAPLK